MTLTLSVLLCLGMCLSQRMRTQADTLPRPFLRADYGPLVPQGRNVTLRCQGSLKAEWYRLVKNRSGKTEHIDEKSDKSEVEFPILSMTPNDAGTYSCLYIHSSGHWSGLSEPLQLVVTGLYFPPFLSAWPSSEVASGHYVTLRCQSQLWHDKIALYKDGKKISDKQSMAEPHGSGYWANFLIPSVNSTHGGTYRCYTFHSSAPYEWSSPSEPLVLRVSVLSSLHARILMGISAFLLLFFLFLFLLLLYQRRCHHQNRLRNGGREGEVKKTTNSSDLAGTPLEETLYAAVNDDRQTEEVKQKDMNAPTREDPQEVTYAQLNLNHLKSGAHDSPPSGPVEPSLYAALR